MQQASQAVFDVTPQAALQNPATFAETFYFSYVCLTDLMNEVALLRSEVNAKKGSLAYNCGVLDDLLHDVANPRDCCITDLQMVCLLRSTMLISTATARGVCDACPASVLG